MIEMDSFERLIENKHAARIKREDKVAARLEAREAKAERFIGELASGKCYVFPVGGKYREGSRPSLLAYLLRNNYA